MNDWIIPAVVAVLIALMAFLVYLAGRSTFQLPSADPREHLTAALAQVARGREAIEVVLDAAAQVEHHLDRYEEAISAAHEWEDTVDEQKRSR